MLSEFMLEINSYKYRQDNTKSNNIFINVVIYQKKILCAALFFNLSEIP